jgi:site-specific DNA-cytosine methylase
MSRDVLILNSYAGSLTIAASQEGANIRGSYEDAGYGLAIQRANFPHLKFLDKYHQWPVDDLSETYVLAHPPCAAFSVQNNSPKKMGTDAKKFECTIQCLDYALRQKCAALAIESVPPALEGAREVHDQWAGYGYHVFRILQNCITYGVPQWRPRFWVIFVRKDLLDYFTISHKPQLKSIGEVMSEGEPGDYDWHVGQKFNRMVDKFDKLGWTQEFIDDLLNPTEDAYQGVIARVLQKKLELDEDIHDTAARYLVGGNPNRDFESGFISCWSRVWRADRYVSTILLDSHFVVAGRPLSIAEYCAAMGFPRDYKWPAPHNKRFREYLSRGVCPPVARWVLQMIKGNLEEWPDSLEPTHTVYPGETLDLNIKKSEFDLYRQPGVKTSEGVYR